MRSVSCPAGVDWRHKLETQRGAVLATELKNNANKLAKWTAAALVSGVEIIKLGYVSRVHQRDTRHHVILGTQVCICTFCVGTGAMQCGASFTQEDRLLVACMSDELSWLKTVLCDINMRGGREQVKVALQSSYLWHGLVPS